MIFATPEYSYTLPGVLKNFIDWQALPVPQANPLGYKPVGILGASIGTFGTYRAQVELRKALMFTDSQVMTKPEVYVAHAGDKFDAEGNLTDQEVWGLLERFLTDFEEFSRATIARDLPSLNREYLWT